MRDHYAVEARDEYVTELDNVIYCFFRGHGNESCNRIGSLSGQYFPISAHGPR